MSSTSGGDKRERLVAAGAGGDRPEPRLTHHGRLSGDMRNDRHEAPYRRPRSDSVRATPDIELQRISAGQVDAHPLDVATANEELSVRHDMYFAAQEQYKTSPQAAHGPPTQDDIELLRNPQSAYEHDWANAGRGDQKSYWDNAQLGVAQNANGAQGVGVSGATKAGGFGGGQALQGLASYQGGGVDLSVGGTDCAGREAVVAAWRGTEPTDATPSAPEGLAHTLIETATAAVNPALVHQDIFTEDNKGKPVPRVRYGGRQGTGNLGHPSGPVKRIVKDSGGNFEPVVGRTRPRASSIAAIRSSCAPCRDRHGGGSGVPPAASSGGSSRGSSGRRGGGSRGRGGRGGSG